jgi:hypothetical protein
MCQQGLSVEDTASHVSAGSLARGPCVLKRKSARSLTKNPARTKNRDYILAQGPLSRDPARTKSSLRQNHHVSAGSLARGPCVLKRKLLGPCPTTKYSHVSRISRVSRYRTLRLETKVSMALPNNKI